MNRDSRVFVAGHRGLVGSAISRKLEKTGHRRIQKTELYEDLRHPDNVTELFRGLNPEYVFLAAAKVGGIVANQSRPVDFLHDNLTLATSILGESYAQGVKKLLFLGSSCIYPKLAPQPLKEDSLLTGPLEPTNEPYAIAKIAGFKLCQAYRKQYDCNFITAMPCNLYGPGDNFHPTDSHVIPGMIRKFHEAKMANVKEVILWGTGKPLREFLYVDDLAEALYLMMQKYDGADAMNIGSGEEVELGQLALEIKKVVGFKGDIVFDASKPDGTPRKIVDSSRIHRLGWKEETSLCAGLKKSYAWAMENGKLK